MTRVVCLCLSTCVLVGVSARVANAQATPPSAPPAGAPTNVDTMAGFERGFLNSIAKGPQASPLHHLTDPYKQRSLPHPVLMNSPRLREPDS